MAEEGLPCGVVLEGEEEGVGWVIEPYLDSYVLEEVAVASDELDLSVCEL